jgi:RNA polymerase sigma-70 factor (ECF subfamily)
VTALVWRQSGAPAHGWVTDEKPQISSLVVLPYIFGVLSLPADDVLLAGLRAGDEATFARLVDAWSPGMLRLARSFVSTADSAAEVVQDTWLAVIEGLDRFEGRSALKTWVYRILVNTAKKRGVRESHSVPLTSLLPSDADRGPTVDPARFRGPDDEWAGHWQEVPPAWPSPESRVLAGELRDRIERALAQLPARQRIVITLRDVEGYSAEEVCDILQLSAGNQRVLLHRARSALRQALEDYYAPRVARAGGRHE